MRKFVMLMFALLAGLSFAGVADGAERKDPDRPWLVTCDDERVVRRTPFHIGISDEQLCGEVEVPGRDPNRGAPDIFIQLFGDRPTVANSGLSGFKLRVARQQWDDRLDQFAGAVTPDTTSDTAYDPEVFQAAGTAGELEFLTEANAETAANTFLFYVGDVPVYYLRNTRAGPKLFAAFVNLDITYELPAGPVLRYPGVSSAVTSASLERRGVSVPNPHPLLE